MKRVVLVTILCLLLILPLNLAQEEGAHHMKLLAVQDTANEYVGSDADLFLELREGTGRIFLDTQPLTKLDTQISTRVAKELACNHFNIDCNQYDFIYTIRAKSNIIGGPSAGAAIAALTTIAVLDLPFDDDVAITGTINSGGIIGPVGGIKEKIDAAAEAGIDKVLIAKGARIQRNDMNETLDMVEYAKENLSLEVIEVENLDEVVFEFTQRDLNHKEINITENQAYTNIMQNLQEALCNRTQQIESTLRKSEITFDENTTQDINNKKKIASNATKQEDYYSAASYCFGVNIDLRRNYYTTVNLSIKDMQKKINVLENKTQELEQRLAQKKIRTISDLQTIMIVKERLRDTQESIKEFEEAKIDENLELLHGLVAYAQERFSSALSWAQFFAMDGKKFSFSEVELQNACLQKIGEADQRYQYTSFFVPPTSISGIAQKVTDARLAFEAEEYELCLILGSQAKADANAILSTVGVEMENVDTLIESKKTAAQRVISQNSAQDIFPILGYSYFKYGSSLQSEQPFTALLYMEYALEMSELGMYFEQEFAQYERGFHIPKDWTLILEGFLVGVLVSVVVTIVVRKKQRKHHKRLNKAPSSKKK